MSLLPPQFQTPAPDALGAKITAMPAPPKPPHVHQWLAVPDSKIHSRCAECGAVTLTEVVAPKPAAPFTFIPNDGMTQMLKDVWAAIDFGIPGSDRTVFSEHFMAKPVNKTVDEVRMKYAASRDRMAALHARFTPPPAQRHYTSITAPDGKVRMVETDAEGWIANTGTQPVADDVRVQIRFRTHGEIDCDMAEGWYWKSNDITHWRPAA